MKKSISIFIAMMVLATEMFAQTISINVVLPAPHSPRLEDYSGRNLSTQLITVTNLSTNPQSIKLKGQITGNNGVSIFTKNEYTPPLPLELLGNETRVLTAGDFSVIFGESAIGFNGVDKNEILRTRIIPEGTYTYCIEAYDYSQPGWEISNRLSAGSPLGCTEINIEYIEPPLIQAIGTAECGGTIANEDIAAMGMVQNLSIGWFFPAGADLSTNYRVTVVEVNPASRDANDAINSATAPVFYETNTNRNFIILDNTTPKLMRGQKYAIRIQASNSSQSFRNRGYSEVCSFVYGSGNAQNGGNALTVTQVYPPPGATIPFQSFPIITKWDPYNDNITHFSSNYVLRSGGVQTESNTRDLNWPRGPLETQRRVTGFAEMTQDQAQHIAVNNLRANGQPVTDYLRGKHYEFDVNVACRVPGNGVDLQGSVHGEFFTGMPRPILQSPQNEKTVAAGEVELSFFTGSAPAHIVPPYAIVQAQRNGGPQFFNCGVNEKFVLVLARSQDFNEESIVDTFMRPVGRNFDLMAEPEEDIKGELYKTVRKTFRLRDTGWYYWKVMWLNDVRSADKRETYNSSEVFSFRIGSGARVPVDPARTTPASCIEDCISSIPANTNPIASLSVGQTVRLGKFNLLIGRLTNATAPYNGEGTIQVPMIGARLRVTFNSLRVNTDLQAFAGTATSINDAPTVVSEEMARQGASFVGMTDVQAQEVNRLLGTGGRLVSLIRGANPEIGLPLGLDNQINGVRHTIAIVGMHFSAERATLNAMASFDYPELNGWLSLAAGDICFHPNGINAGEGRLYNPTDKHLIFSPDVRMVFTAPDFARRDSGTFVSWDCNGFKALHIKGEFRFSRNVFVPDSITGDAAMSGIVKARFHTVVNGVNQWMLRLDMDPFQLTGLPEWGFVPRNMIFDFNSISNFEEMHFPEGYATTSASWKGFFMQQMEVRLPKQFRTYSDPTRRLRFSANNMLIDRTGFTGNILGQNIVNVREGNADGWGFGIDSIYLELVSNGFRRAGLNGEVKVPIGQRPIDYRMVLNRNGAGQFGYECLIQPQDTLKATLINPAVLRLTPTSRIEITKRIGEDFRLLGVLDGDISIEGRIEPIGAVDFRGMAFEQLTIENRRPYVNCRALRFNSPPKSAAGFPVQLDSFRFVTATEPGPGEFNRDPGFRVGLSMGVKVELIRENNTFGGSTRLNFMAVVRNRPNQPFVVEFSGISCEGVGVKGTIGPVSVDGGLQFYTNNATYGDGIRGYINATFRPALSLQAIVQFGTVANRPYFYIDGSARIPRPGLPFVPGAMNVVGFGGSVSYGMRLTNMPSASEVGSNPRPDISTIGATSTGCTVVPDRNQGFGFSARMYAVAPTGNAYKAMIELGARFNNSGGISQMNLGGNLIVMSETDNPAEAKVGANMNMIFDFERAIFDGRFDVWVNMNGVVRGRQAGNRAGQIHMYADSSTWFIKIGKPARNERAGLIVSLLRQIEVNGYVMVGRTLEPIPDLPEEITRLMRNTPLPIRDPRVTTGDGFAFGAEIRDEVPRINFLMFYAQLQYILGFDVSILRTPGLTCDNAGGRERGVDGWYSEGQLYAYFAADLGIHVDVWFVEGDFPIFKTQLAGAIQGGFPNPNWFKGFVGGNYKILGGLIQGHVEFEVAIGERCVPPVDVLSGFELVTQLNPRDGETEVEVGISPAAAFNIAPGHQDTFSYTDGLGRRQLKTFRVTYKNFNLNGGTTNISQPVFGGPMSFANFEKSSDGKVVGFTPIDYLNANTRYTLSITAIIEFYENGAWVQGRSNGRILEKTYTSRFTTGAFPDRIPESDIQYSYPHRGQRYFLQAECRNGFIKSRRNLAPFFNRTMPGATTSYHVEFVPVDGSSEPIRTNLNTAGISNQINFSIPNLSNGKVYAIRIIEKNVMRNLTGGGNQNKGKMEQNNPIVTRQITRNIGLTNVSIANTQLLAATRVSFEENLLVYYFRTSNYNTLNEKMTALTNITSRENRLFDEGDGAVRNFQINLFTPEPFDEFDAIGEQYQPIGNRPDNRVWSGGLVKFMHAAGPVDLINRRDRIYSIYDLAARNRVINSTFTIGIINFNTPQTMYSLSDNYTAIFANNGYRPRLSTSEYLPAPAPRFIGGFGNNLSAITPIIYTGYQDAHRAKTQLANAFVLINAMPLYWSTYYQRSTAADRVKYQEVITTRRFTGYPACQNLNFRAEFVLPLSCFRDVDAGRTGSVYRFTTLYPPCIDAPR